MENVEHLWNITQALVTNENIQANVIRNHYVRCCQDLFDTVESPKHIFGLNTMCNYCGSLWSTVGHKIRICKGRGMSKAIQKLVRKSNKDSSSLTRFKKKLVQRCVKKQANKLVITCLVCKKNNEVVLNKPKRFKKLNRNEVAKITPKKKKSKKNKSAGLMINTPNVSNNSRKIDRIFRDSDDGDNKYKALHKTKKMKNRRTPNTPKCKSNKINISKLKGMINTSITPLKKTNLHSFLNELG